MAKNELVVDISANIKDLVKAIEEAKKLIGDLSSTLSQGIKLAVDVKSIKSDIKSVKSDIKNELIAKPFKVKVETDGNKLKASIKSALREAIKEINNQGVGSKLKLPADHKFKVKVDTNSARTSIKNLQSMLSKHEIRINTTKAEGDIIRLATYMNQLGAKKITPQIDTVKAEQAKLSITELATYMNQLQSKKIKIDIEFANKDIVNHLKSIDDLLKSIQKNSNIKLNVSGTGKASSQGGVQSQIQQYRTLRQEAKHFALEAEKAWTAGNKQGFEQNRQNFLVAMKDLADFSRQLGNLSASKEAGMYTNMLRSLQQTSPLYNDILNKIKQLKKEQKDFNNLIGEGNKKLAQGSGTPKQREGRVPGFMQGTVGAAAYAIHFLGRSSKGFGSFGEATAELISDFNSLGGTVSKTMIPIAALAGTVAITVTAFTAAIKGVEFFGGLLKQIGQEVYNALKPGIDLYKQQTSAFFSFTASLMSNGVIGGQKLSDMPNGMDTAMGLSNKLLQRAQIDAEMSAFSLQDILASLQGTLPILMSKGMTMEQAYEINKGVAAVAKMIQLTPSQILQETRDLAQGSITSRGSQVANALGVTNADLKKFEGDAEGLFNFLMERFKQYGELLQQFEDTAIGRFQQLEERWQTVARSMIDGMLPQFKGAFEALINATGQWVATSGTYINEFGERVKYDGVASLDALTGKWKDAQGEIINGFQQENAIFELAEPFKEIQTILPEIVTYLADMVDRIVAFIEEETGINDPIEIAKEVIIAIADGFETSVKLLVKLIGFVKDWSFVLIPVLNILRGITNFFIVLVTSAEQLGSELAVIADQIKEIYYGIKGDADGMYKARQERIKDEAWRNRSAVNNMKAWDDLVFAKRWESLEDIIGKNVSENLGFLGKAVRESSEEGKYKEKTTGTGMDKVKGVTKSTEDDKARKKAIQEAQRVMKEHIQGLKERLKDHISQLKDTLEKNKIAYDEGFMSMKEYFEQKAQIEAEEARLRLAEAKEEREWILKTPYEHEADQLKALHTVDREIRQYTRELGKATKAQQEVADVMEKYIEVQQAFTKFMASSSSMGKKTGGFSSQGYNYSDVSQIGEGTESLARLAVDLVKRAKEVRGVDLDVGKLLGLFFAEVGKNGNSENWLINKNPAGFTANTATPDNMVDWGGGRGPGEAGNYERYTDVPYMDMLDHIVNTWLKWYQHELEVGVSTAEMNAGLQGVFHTADIDRTSTYDEGVEYAKQHSMYEAVQGIEQASNSLNEASSNLMSASGDLLGYTPEAQYSRAGMDTRYSDFQEMSSGVETQISGLNDNVRALFNLFAKKYFEKTGEKVLWTSFTGDLRNGGANNPHSSSEKGHRYGWKGDLWVNNSSIATQIAQELGLALGDEFDHLDLSAWGGVGGTLLTTNATAEELHTKLISVNQAMTTLASNGVSEFIEDITDLNDIMSVIFKYAPDLGSIMNLTSYTTEGGHEAYKVAQERLDNLVTVTSENGMRIVGNITAQIMKDVPKLFSDIKKYRTDPKMLEQIVINYRNSVRDKLYAFNKNMAEFNLKVMERNAEFRGTDIISGKYSFRDMFNLYRNYFTDMDNKLGIGRYIKALEDLYSEYESLGQTDVAFEIREEIDNLKQKFVDMQKKWIDKIGEFYDRQQNLFDATEGFTDLQREFGTRELNAYKAQANYEAYSIALADVNKQIVENNKNLKEAQEFVKNLAEGTKERAKYESKISTYTGEASRLEGLRQEYEYQQKLNDLQRQQPSYLRDLRNTAKQALEDGLVTFLTDGVNEAESLSDALRDLAISFLKEIQQMSAKWMVKSLMNQWFGQYEMPTPPSVDSTNVAGAVTTGASAIVEAIGQQTTALTNGKTIGSTTATTQTYAGAQGNWLGQNSLGAFSSTWQNSPLNPNRQYTFNAQDYDLTNSFGNLGVVAQTASSNINLLGDSSNQVGNTLVDALGNSEVQSADMERVATTTQVTSVDSNMANIITTNVIPALSNLATQLQTLASSMMGVGTAGAATGGLIKGPGTSKSDDIPTMLSNGEFVVKAESVKKYGTNFLNALNEGKLGKIRSKIPHFADGGLIRDISQDSTARGVSNFGKSMASNITNTNNISLALVRDEQEGARQLLKSPEGQKIMLDFSRKYARVTSKF